nr:BAG family molecular chaperone regulator 1 [Hymenolepis microstoma]
MSLVESTFGIRRNAQKLIFSGKSLAEESMNLAYYNIKSGSKIMLIGRIEKTDPLELLKLSDLEATVPSLCSEFEGLESMRNSSSNAILKFTEVCMKKLELADSVVLPVAAQEERKRRKDVVNSLNELLSSAEALLASLEGSDESKK